MTTIKDSGERQEFSTGAQRDTQTLKGRFDQIPYEALLRFAQVFELGGLKYEYRNWEKGIPVSRFLNSAIRHLLKANQGYTDEPHLAMAGWNICCAIATAERAARGFLPPELLDIPSSLEDFNPSWLEGEIPAYTKEGLRVGGVPEGELRVTEAGEKALEEAVAQHIDDNLKKAFGSLEELTKKLNYDDYFTDDKCYVGPLTEEEAEDLGCPQDLAGRIAWYLGKSRKDIAYYSEESDCRFLKYTDIRSWGWDLPPGSATSKLDGEVYMTRRSS